MISEAIQHLQLFVGLRQEHLDVLIQNLRPLSLDAGDTLIEEGVTTRGPLFIVDQGSVEVTRRDEQGKAHVLATLKAPTVIGELELLADVRCSASVRALTTLGGVLLPRERFEALLASGEPAAYHLALAIGRLACERLATTNTVLIKALSREPERMRTIVRAQLDPAMLANIDAELDALVGKTEAL